MEAVETGGRPKTEWTVNPYLQAPRSSAKRAVSPDPTPSSTYRTVSTGSQSQSSAPSDDALDPDTARHLYEHGTPLDRIDAFRYLPEEE